MGAILRRTSDVTPVTFYRLIEEAPPPARADRSGMGSLPTRAYRWCDAVTAASGWGWHVFPPINLELLWDGVDVFWRAEAVEGLEAWMVLAPAVQFPYFAARFDAAVPEGLRGFSPPFLTTLQEPGIVQVWTGLMARTAPGWSLLVRGPANPPRRLSYEPYEGIIETDRWFGPLFTNLRLTRTGVAVRLDPQEPFLQVQPVPQAAYADAVLNKAMLVPSLTDLSAADWAEYHTSVVAPNLDPDRRPGRYSTEGRRQRKSAGCPYAALTAAEAAAGVVNVKVA